MHRGLTTVLTILVSSILLFGWGMFILHALEVSVSATVPSAAPPEVPETQVHFLGLAYPGSQVTIQKDGVNVAVVQANPNATFDVTITVDPGSYTFIVFGTDADGVQGSSFQTTLTLTAGTTVTVSGIFLGPTITVEEPTYTVGDTVTLFGITAPESTVTLLMSSPDETPFTVDADANGQWVRSFIAGADTLTVGDHEARAKAIATDSSVSEYSKTVDFAVAAAAPVEPDPCDGKNVSDLNCDGKVNLVDFSIMLFYWQQRNPANARADINTDGIVNIVDFSILLFHWTG